jgi:hypothetical protein
MATITLTANTNYSALSVANGDTIDLAGFALTFDANPAETGVIVQSPGTNGTIAIGSPNVYDFSGWSFTAGNAVLLGTLETGKTVGGNWTGGAASSNIFAITTNSGTINGNVTGGSGNVSNGVFTNNGTINGNVTGGSGTNSRGVQQNNGTINGNVTGGTGASAAGVLINAGTIDGDVAGGSGSGAAGLRDNTGLITGNVSGSGATGAHGISIFNSGTIQGQVVGGTTANVVGVVHNRGTILGGTIGGTASGAFGVSLNSGIIFGGIENATAVAVGTYEGSVLFVDGPNVIGTIAAPISTIYSLGTMNPSATLPSGATVITLSEGTGTAGFTGIEGISRSLGT